MERVSIIHGNKPILLIAPHGPEDRNTDTFTASAAKALGCSAVINRGFIKGPRVDVSHDIANCDHVSHCRSPVVYDEFMRPIHSTNAPLLREALKEWLADRKLSIVEEQ